MRSEDPFDTQLDDPCERCGHLVPPPELEEDAEGDLICASCRDHDNEVAYDRAAERGPEPGTDGRYEAEMRAAGRGHLL